MSPVLSFLGAALGAWVVYRMSRAQERSRRFEAALEMLGSSDPRQRAFGRARIVEMCRLGTMDRRSGRSEALAVLREDVRSACPDQIWQALNASSAAEVPRVWIAEEGQARVDGGDVHVTRSTVDAAIAYVEVAGGEDAAPDQLVALLAQANAYLSGEDVPTSEPRPVDEDHVRPLPRDQALILVKLSPDAAKLGPAELRERARKAWRLSIERVRSEPPTAVAAVAQQRVIGAWQFEGVAPSAEAPNRVEFLLGEEVSDLVGRHYTDTSQNPVRYWP